MQLRACSPLLLFTIFKKLQTLSCFLQDLKIINDPKRLSPTIHVLLAHVLKTILAGLAKQKIRSTDNHTSTQKNKYPCSPLSKVMTDEILLDKKANLGSC